MSVEQTYSKVFEAASQTKVWQEMVNTREDSQWHREPNVATHTLMVVAAAKELCDERGVSDRIKLMTLIAALFHDFGKPEAEEVLERKDGSGVYRRYAGHEPKSANEFISAIMSPAFEEARTAMFLEGLTYHDLRRIKFMIEHHLPYGLKNQQKVAALRRGVIETLGEVEEAFYLLLEADCRGRISDDHETKIQTVLDWIQWFKAQEPAKKVESHGPEKTMYLLVGPSGVGKSTSAAALQELIRSMTPAQYSKVVSPDETRLRLFRESSQVQLSPKDEYRQAYLHTCEHQKEFDQALREELHDALSEGCDVIVDGAYQTRKAWRQFIQKGREFGYRIETIEFFATEALVKARQKTRPDKDVPEHRVHDMYMRYEVLMEGVDIDSVTIIPAHAQE